MRFLYAIFKLFPVNNNRIIFLSRQASSPSIDFKLLESELIDRSDKLNIVFICKRLEKNALSTLGFGIAVIKSMYFIATSKVCVLESYWPAISMLNHKESLKVIQIWHSMGKIKKSGFQTIDKAAGRDMRTARLMNMHENYDLIIAGGSAWNPFYCTSFNTTAEKLYNVGLPRRDYLMTCEQDIKERIYEQHPKLQQKPVVLYAPTFRKSISDKWKGLITSIDLNKFNLIIKGHPNQKISYAEESIFRCDEFTGYELLAVCDYLITDYSAIAVEAALLERKTLYFVYDYEEYKLRNGLNIHLYDEMPGLVFKNAGALVNYMENERYNMEALLNYKNKFLPNVTEKSTVLITNKIMEYMESKL